MTNNMTFHDARKAIMAVDRLIDASSDPELKPAILKIENAIDRADDAARTPGQIAMEAATDSMMDIEMWGTLTESQRAAWEAAAQAVIAWHEQQPTEEAPDPDTAPSWSPVVGGWAEHADHGRVLVLDFIDEDRIPQYRIYRRGGCIVEWVTPTSLSAPVPRVWDRAEDVPSHVVVRDAKDFAWPGCDLDADDTEMGPFTEVIGGVW